jgi:murein peptide amidase A
MQTAPINPYFLQRRTIGHSRQQIPIQAYFLEPRATHQKPLPKSGFEPFPKIDTLFFGAFHGDEPESATLLFRLIDALAQEPTLLAKKPVVIVPIVNPDGLLANTRKNASGVDINRNFRTTNWESNHPEDHYYAGLAPLSEPETHAVVNLIEACKPQKIITVHTPYRLVNYDGPNPQTQAWAEDFGRFCNYPVEASIGYPTPGSFGSWAGLQLGIPVITLELPEGEPHAVTWESTQNALFDSISRTMPLS